MLQVGFGLITTILVLYALWLFADGVATAFEAIRDWLKKGRLPALAAIVLAALAIPDSFGQWGRGAACAVAQPVISSPAFASPTFASPTFASPTFASPMVSISAPPPISAFHWKQSGEDWHLFRQGVLVGGLSTKSGGYRPWIGDQWGDYETPPTVVPASVRTSIQTQTDRSSGALRSDAKAAKADAPRATSSSPAKETPQAPVAFGQTANEHLHVDGQELPTGVDWSKISSTPKITRRGQAVPRDSLFIEGALTDDSKKDRITFVAGDKAKRQAAMKAFAESPAFASLRPNCLAWETSPDDWSMEPGFPRVDNQVILQAASGKVIARVTVPDVGDAQAVVGALRKANPNYDPLKDPGQPNQPAGPGGFLAQAGQWIPIGLAAIVLFLAVKK